ncbi:MAG TPA: M28 family peptidase, partial [bacterium]|nr:M28 family peptidase [bacterium]
MKWIVSAVVVIALTVSFAVWTGRPKPLELKVPPSISEGGVAEDLDFERIQDSIRRFSGVESRVTGYPGCQQTLELIQRELTRIGVTDFQVQEFSVPAPIVESSVLIGHTDSGDITIPVHPLWPNLARTCQTGPDGISGSLIDVGAGNDNDLAGKDLRERIALMDWNSRSEWLNVPEFGGKAVIFRANDRGDGYTARDKFMTIPADFPRFYVTAEFFPTLDELLSAQAKVTLHCQMQWRNVTARNLLVRVCGTKDNSKNINRDEASLIFHAYYDSISVVPGLAPGAEQACGAATLLELAHYFSKKEFDRPIYLLFTGAHGQALEGMAHFVRTLRDGSKSNWAGEPKDSLIVRMGKPSLFVGLDLSSRSERLGVFCVGRFRAQREDRLRPKFSTLGLKLDEYAKSFQTVPDATESLSPFVDCINLTLGRGWWTYFPYQAPFESELPNLSAYPAITLSTINDDRRYVDTPDDTWDRMRPDLFKRQIMPRQGEHVGLANLALALASWSGPFTGGDLSDVWSRLSGRVVWLNQQEDYTPNEPLVAATVFLKTQRGDKYLMGTRGIPCAMTDDNGTFHFDGLTNITANWDFNNCTVEPYGTATSDFISKNQTAYDELMKVRNRGGK